MAAGDAGDDPATGPIRALQPAGRASFDFTAAAARARRG